MEDMDISLPDFNFKLPDIKEGQQDSTGFSGTLDLGLDIDFQIDMEGLGIDLDNIQVEKEETKESKVKFNHTYSVEPMGLNFNLLYKENVVLITNILGLSLTSIKGRSQVKEFFIDCDIFLEHIDAKLNDMEGTEDYEMALNIYSVLSSNLEYLKDRLKIYNYSAVTLGSEVESVSRILNNRGKFDSIGEIDISTLSTAESSMRMIEDIVNYRYSTLNDSPVHTYHREFTSLLQAHMDIGDLLAYTKQLLLEDKTRDPLSVILKKDSVRRLALQDVNKYRQLTDMLEYVNKSYEYSPEELKVMGKLDFPITICGRENFFKPNLGEILKDRCKSSKPRNKKYLDYGAFRRRRESDMLLELNKIKSYIDNKGKNEVMGSLYF